MWTIKDEFTGWKLNEIIWLTVSIISVTVCSLFFNDTIYGVLAASCGITASVLTGKGKLSAYVIGGIGRIIYGFIAFKTAFYGEVMLNFFYFVPMEFYGIYVWNKNMNTQTKEVRKRSMNLKQLAILFITIAVLTTVYGFILKRIGGKLPFIDSLTNIISIIAMILTIKRYSQTWLLWMIVNAVSILMWLVSFTSGTGSIAVLMMWIIYFINSSVMFIKWTREIN